MQLKAYVQFIFLLFCILFNTYFKIVPKNTTILLSMYFAQIEKKFYSCNCQIFKLIYFYNIFLTNYNALLSFYNIQESTWYALGWNDSYLCFNEKMLQTTIFHNYKNLTKKVVKLSYVKLSLIISWMRIRFTNHHNAINNFSSV